MNTMPMNTRSIASIPQCWVYANKVYTYTEYGRTVDLSLPTVDMEYQGILEKLGIAHKLNASGQKFEIWDPECYTEVMLPPLPLYLSKDYEYRYIKKYTDSVISKESLEAARKIYEEQVKPEIIRFQKRQERCALVLTFKKFLNGRPACGVSRYSDELLRQVPDSGLDLALDNNHIRVFKVNVLMSESRKARLLDEYWDHCGVELETSADFDKIDTEYLAIFDVTKCEVGSKITIEVPLGTEGIFVGRQGWQVKEWCEKMGGLLKITVKGV
jgi:hypothetical protein